MSNEIFFYSKSGCPKCSQVKQLLDEKGLKYSTCQIDDADCLCSLVEKNVDIASAPILQVNDQFYTYKNGFVKIIRELSENKDGQSN
jgi:glutaredoxin